MLPCLFSVMSLPDSVRQKGLLCIITTILSVKPIFQRDGYCDAIVYPFCIGHFLSRETSSPFRPVREGTVSFLLLSQLNGSESFSSAKSRWVRDFINYYLGYILISFLCMHTLYFPEKPIGSVRWLHKGSITINFMTMVKILASYVKLMFLPFHLSADYTIAPVLSILMPPLLQVLSACCCRFYYF